MARRRGLDKFTAPEPEPAPQAAPAQDQQASAPAPEEKAFESERLMLFGPPETQKNIVILAVVGFVAMGLVYFILAKDERPFPVAGLVFTAIHGGLLGMLLGQLILVYADRIIILFTLMGVVLAETLYVAARWTALENFVFNRMRFQEILAIFFWAGFVGFWVGFVFYVKQLRARQNFQRRFMSGERRNL